MLDDLPMVDKEIQDKIKHIDDLFALSFKSRKFDGEKGEEVLSIKAFERTCIYIRNANYHSNPRLMPTIQFFTALDEIKERNKSRSNAKSNKNQ